MKKTYQGPQDESKQKFEVIGKGEMLVEVPLPMVGVWEELQAEVEQLTGQAGPRVAGRLRDSGKRGEAAGWTIAPARAGIGSCALGRQPGYVVFGGRQWSSNVHGCAREKAGKWNWTVMRGCNTTGGGSARCAKASSRD